MKWITANDLGMWASCATAKPLFPGLIADLIRASADDISAFRFPNGEKGYVRGFDGVLQSDAGAKPFVPPGCSIWEFGLQAEVVSKADADYKKRTSEVAPEVRFATTLVLVTAHTWDKPRLKRETWLEKKRELKEWAAVELIDGSQLEHWLDDHPAVSARWAREELNLTPRYGARSIDEYWAEFSSRFLPTLTEQVLLCSREHQAIELVDALMAGKHRLLFTADSADEVIAFAVAAIRSADPVKRMYLESRTLVVDTSEAVDQLLGRKDLVFLPRGTAISRAGQLSKIGPTVISAGADEDTRKFQVLQRPSTYALGEALISMFPSQRDTAMAHARKCGRSLAVLARQIPGSAAIKPVWHGTTRPLIPALLAGGWDASRQMDKAVLHSLGRAEAYEAVEEPLRSLAVSADPPIDRVDTVWRMRACVDAFTYLGKHIGEPDWKALATVVQEVLGRIVMQPDFNGQFTPGWRPEETHSAWLREGLATTLLLIATLGDELGMIVPGSTPQRFVDDIVSGLPGIGSDWRVIASLRDDLPKLAEASPDGVLGALESLLDSGVSNIAPLFAESEDIFAPTSPHVFVLFALELLAWDPAHLPRVSRALARLASFDPGLKMENRPVNTLRATFLAWSPCTHAPSKLRDAVLTSIIEDFPDLAWELLVKLLPKFSDSCGLSQKPLFREAGASNQEVLTYNIVRRSQGTVVRLALKHSAGHSSRVVTLMRCLGQLHESDFNLALDVAAEVMATGLATAKHEVWEAVRWEAKRHRSFASADWALEPAAVAKLDALVDRFRSKDPLSPIVELFDGWLSDLPGGDSRGAEAARVTAVGALLGSGGVEAILELAKRIKDPYALLLALKGASLSDADCRQLVLSAVGDSHPSLPRLATMVSGWMFSRDAPWWCQTLVNGADENGWNAETLASLLMLPDCEKSWALIDGFGVAVAKAYWRMRHPLMIDGSSDVLAIALGRYLAEGRAIAAMLAGHNRLAEVSSEMLLRMLAGAIVEINAAPTEHGDMTGYCVGEIFNVLETRADVSEQELAKLELSYLGFLHNRKAPLKLHQLMVRWPEQFMYFVRMVYSPLSPEQTPVDDRERRMAEAAFRLLEDIRIVPGQAGDDVDEHTLIQWCLGVKELAAEVDADLEQITEEYIGRILAYSPDDPGDKGWPHRAVRNAIDKLRSADVERGIVMECHRKRGAILRSFCEGGGQERRLAEKARKWSELAASHERTSAMLLQLAASWEEHAKLVDLRADRERLRS